MDDGRRPFRAILVAMIAFGAAFGYLEATVVVYLRRIYCPGGFGFPILPISAPTAAVEIVREAATLVMLGAAAFVAGRTRWERFGWFAFLFGVWDIVFYAGLYAVLRWPASLLTWDLLFLIPLVWAGPVLAPLLVSLLLVSGGAALALRERRGRPARVRAADWAIGAAGVLLLLAAFMANHGTVASGGVPRSFPWIPFLIGWVLAAASGARVLLRKD